MFGLFGFDRYPVTKEGGIYILMKNGTGQLQKKGTMVSTSKTTDNEFVLQSVEYDAIGALYTDIPSGEIGKVVISGYADVLLKDNTAAVHGNWVKCADTDGRADASNAAPPGGGFVNADEHFKEIGHCLQSVTPGINKLCGVILHFN